MIRLELSAVINRPVGDVFSYVADMSTHPQWDHGCVEAAYTSSGPIRVGLGYRRVDKAMGMTFKGTGEVAEYEPNRKVTWTIGPPTPGRMTANFEAAQGGTKVSALYEVRTRGLMRLLEPLLAGQFRGAAKKSMSNLKARLEAKA